jgi:multidrug transporter EmrE-like cation transporter
MAIALACLSAFLHALWNLIGKRNSSDSDFYLLANIGCVILLSPVLLFCPDLIPLICLGNPILVSCSILAQIVYMWLLSRAYSKGEMSVVYPIARTLPVPMVFLFEFLCNFSTGKALIEVLGVSLICAGVIVTCFRSGSKTQITPIVYAFFIGIAISCYSVLDHRILSQTLEATGASRVALCLTHMFILELGVAVGLGIPQLRSKASRQNFIRILITDGHKSLIMGAGIVASYVVALIALTYTNSPSVVVTFRQLSIPLGFILGLYVLKERSHRLKWAGMTLICSGLFIFATH